MNPDCPHCGGVSPSTDGKTECGWCGPHHVPSVVPEDLDAWSADERLAEAIQRCRDNPFVPPPPGPIRVGDIREVDSSPWETWEPPEADEDGMWLGYPADIVRRRWVLVTNVDSSEYGYVYVALCGTPMDDWGWMTDREVWLDREDTGHYRHCVFCDLRGPVFTHQLGDLVARLDNDVLAIAKAASRGANTEHAHRSGIPLQSRKDPRRAYKQDQMRVLHRIIGPCASWMLEETA